MYECKLVIKPGSGPVLESLHRAATEPTRPPNSKTTIDAYWSTFTCMNASICSCYRNVAKFRNTNSQTLILTTRPQMFLPAHRRVAPITRHARAVHRQLHNIKLTQTCEHINIGALALWLNKMAAHALLSRKRCNYYGIQVSS